jgi:hypothetical protein
MYPVKPALTAPGIKRLKVQYDQLHSSFPSKFNLRRYSMADAEGGGEAPFDPSRSGAEWWTQAGAYTRPLLSTT